MREYLNYKNCAIFFCVLDTQAFKLALQKKNEPLFIELNDYEMTAAACKKS